MPVDEILSGIIGLPTDQVRFIIGNILCVGLCFLLPRISSVKQRTQYSTLLGTLLQFYIYADEPIKISVITLVSVIMYYVTRMSPRHQVGRNVTVLSMVLLSFYHIYRLITDYGSWRIDAATAFMMMVVKYSSFAYSYEDGAKSTDQLFGEQEKNRIVELPTLRQYMDYIQFLPTAAVGPALEYREFERYILQEDQYQHIPNTAQQVTRSFLACVGYISIYMLVCPHF